jgi:hypothetical protein
MNGKKARKLKQISKKEFELNDYKSTRVVYRDLKKLYKDKQIALK